MKQLVLFFFLLSLFFLPYCTTTKNAAGKNMQEPSISYVADVAPILQTRCTPCHFPDQGKKKFLDTYVAARDNIDSIVARVELPISHPKFMPFKSKKEPLSDSLINVLKLWKTQNFPA